MAGNFTPGDHSLALTLTDSTVHFESLEVSELQSVWPLRAFLRS
jgi:hypothetical protein